MIKEFVQSQRQLTFRRINLSLQITILLVFMSIPQGTGGSNNGDPAPGRSPGPPLPSYKPLENVAENPVGGVKTQSNDSTWCTSPFSPELTDLPHVNVTLYHPLFEVFNNLLPGIVYQVAMHPINSEESIEEVFISSMMKDFPVGSWKSESSKKFCSNVTWARLKVNEPAAWSFQLSQPANITFRVRYHLTSGKFYEGNFSYSAVTDCVLRLRQTKGTFGSSDIPNIESCRIIFPRKLAEEPSSDHKEGLLIELTRLNVPCAGGGFIQFIEETNDLEEGAVNSPKKLCGKLEELNSVERKLYFPSPSEGNQPILLVHKNPVFSLSYHLVDYCYNVTFVSRNGSLVLNPVKNLLCHFRVHLPYGNRVLLRLQMGEDKLTSTTQTYDEKAQKPEETEKFKLSSTNQTISTMLNETFGKSQDDEENMFWERKDSERDCDGVLVIVGDGELTWTHCSRHGDPKRDVQVSSQENIVTIKIVVRTSNAEHSGYSVVKFWYHAEPVSEIVSTCEFGEVMVKQFCVSSVKIHLDWDEAEKFCEKHGGHLASIRDENSQNVIDNLLVNSPDYRERDSYWIGASDKVYEGHFRWSDGFAFSYSNWFPGWPQQGFYNRQPNDDGFSHQDCVEIRRVFPHPSGSRIIDGITSSYLWNDLDCSMKNFFLCERLENGESTEQSWNPECNKTITLTREHPKAVVISSGFPHQYPDNIHCETVVMAPPGFRLVIDFEELVLEKEPSCSYDYLELVEFAYNETYVAKKLCGDMSDKLKLLRYISTKPKLKFIFVSDYSHHYGGFKARVSIESAHMECSDERYQMFNNSCYLFVSYPKVTWETANQICRGMKTQLASVLNQEEESFLTGNIRNSLEYTTSASYWLGGRLENPQQGEWSWTDGTLIEYTAWPSNEATAVSSTVDEKLCLAVQWVSSKTDKGYPTSGLYWTSQQCNRIGGYVCKKENQVSGVMLNLNQTVNGTEGHLTSPGYPSPYYHNLDYQIQIVGPVWTRMVVSFTKLDLETQTDCLYDYVELRSGGSDEPEVRWCGNKPTTENGFTFVSNNNEAILRFHSDYSVAGIGFYANWKAVDVTGCPSQKLTAREGIISSPNFGEFLLPRLECTAIILAPPGKRIWLEFTDVNLNGEEGKRKDVTMELDLGGGVRPFQLFQTEEGLGDRNFLSAGGKMAVKLKTLSDPSGNGFRAVYRTVNLAEAEKILELSPDTHGVLHHLNYPADPPPNVDFIQHLIAPVGYVIYLELQQVTLIENGKFCPDGSGLIEIRDNYADVNGTWWFLCEVKNKIPHPTPPLSITSYLNSLHIRQRSSSIGARMNATLKVKQDEKFKKKLLQVLEGGAQVESCRPNPCQNGGKCVLINGKKSCQCIGHFTGMFCALTLCEMEPCVFGQCELTATGYRCHCVMGYTGTTCETKQRPCADNPCEGRGECFEKSGTFHCRCHAWWEGPRCEKRMVHIPFKPLTERMLQEPFWLGLITVFLVLVVLALFWCARRHVPEKLEKLLAEEAERSSRSNVSGITRPPSVREQMSATSGAVTVSNPPSTATTPRTLFGRLGIRKSSLLSLTSPQRPDAATSRTFSLDDILKPPPRSTPSPKKMSSSPSPTKTNVTERKQILQQLVSPPPTESSSPKTDLNEMIVLKESSKKKREPPATKKSEWKETSFSMPDEKSDSKMDLSKLEKKVTFARLLNKVSAEMSSGSEAEMTSGLMRALSTPVSPAWDRKFSRGFGSNAGSDSISSSEIAISGSAFSSMLDIPMNVKRPTRLSYKGAKNASADSILQMFRSFASTSSLTKAVPSPSSTPTPSSPPEDRGISDESSAVETPISSTSGPIDSPTNRFTFGNTIEIPVMDPLTAQKTAASCSGNNLLQPPSILLEIPSGGINKCLSPIREVPTPMSSPALTPVMGRVNHKTVKVEAETSDEEVDKSDNDDGSGFSEVMIQVHREDEILSPTEEDSVHEKFPSEENEVTVTEPPGMVIPLLTVQEPSPPSTSPPGSFPGSPPPYKADTDSFIYSPTNSARRLAKGYEKPNSLDLPFPPPIITITCNVSEPESDAETMSPAPKNPNPSSNNRTANTGGMNYLSPFSMCTSRDRTASESNLSSSGYSSMASPGPSRCNSNNPLCLSEVEDHQHSHSQPPSRRPSPLLRTPTKETNPTEEGKLVRGRSDSETLSDDPLLESNDEGIGTDHIDEKIEEGEVKSARELEILIGMEIAPSTTTATTNDSNNKNDDNSNSNNNNNNDSETVLDFSSIVLPSGPQRGPPKKCENTDTISTLGSPLTKTSLQLPTIVVQSDYGEKLLSPVSSRSESPLSDKALGLGRFSPMFYSQSKNDQLLFTDSDGMYDFPSSDCPISNKHKSAQPGTNSHRKSTGRRRERRSSHRSLTSRTSPVKGQNALLEVPQQRELPSHRNLAQRKPSPKRRIRTQQPLSSSSSSTESLNSGKASALETDTWGKKTETTTLPGSNEASVEDTAEKPYKTTMNSQNDEQQQQQPQPQPQPQQTPQKKIAGFRAIGHQIRFLRRIEQSLKRKEKAMSSFDSDDNEDDTDDPSLSLIPRDSKKVGILPPGTMTQKCRLSKKRNAAATLVQRVPQSSPAQDKTLTVSKKEAN